MIDWNKVRFFLETFFWIVDKQSKEVRFRLNAIQDKFFGEASYKQDIILKARKEGVSALITAVFLVACFVFKNQRAVVISYDKDETIELFKRVLWWVDKLRKIGIKIETDTERQGEVSFPGTHSWFYCGTAGTKAFGRGSDITLLHVTELAWWEHPDMLTGLLEARTDKCWTIIESTPHGQGNKFHNLCVGAKYKRNTWKFHMFTWFDNPEYQVKVLDRARFDASLSDEDRRNIDKYKLSLEQWGWKITKKSILCDAIDQSTVQSMDDSSLFPQEYLENFNEAFMASGRAAFDMKALDMMDTLTRPPLYRGYIQEEAGEFKFVIKDDEPLHIWKPKEEDRVYAIFADVAEGVVGGAFSDATVIDVGSREVVAWYHTRIEPIAYAKVLRKTGIYYNEALICPEFNNHGNATVSWLFENGYKNLYKVEDKPGDSYVDYGWRTMGNLDDLMYSFLREDIRNLRYSIPVEEIIYQLKCCIIDEKGKLKVNTGFKDSVICLGIASAVLQRLPHEEVTTTKTFRERLDRVLNRHSIGHPFRSKHTYAGT